MRRIIIALIFSLGQTLSALSSPQGSWPAELKGVGLPTPDWILVLPAKREPSGTIKLWDKDDPWNREWVVPKATPTGIRTVAIAGDAEDRRVVADWHVDTMDVTALSMLAEKYSAPAIAVVVQDDMGDTAIAAWMPEYEAVWDAVGATDGDREPALHILEYIFRGHEDAAVHYTANETEVIITGQRFNGSTYEYRLELIGNEAEGILKTASGIEIVEYIDTLTDIRTIVVRGTDGRDIETILMSNGINF